MMEGITAIATIMISIGVVGFIFSICAAVINWEDLYTKSKVLAIIIIIICIILIISGILVLGSYENRCVVYDEIVSIEQNSETSGSFVLGTGTVDNNIVYYMYAKTDKGLILYDISASNNHVYIVETDEITPHVEIVKEKWKKEYYVIYVPENTVRKQFVIE